MPIHFVSVQVNGPIFWVIAREDPSLFYLSDSTEWLFLNPILYDQLELFLPYIGSFYQFVEEKYFGHTTGIAFATRSDDAMQSGEAKGFSNLALISVGLLARLRHASGQATIPSGNEAVVALGITKRDELPVPHPVDDLKGAKTQVQEYWWKTAITAEHIRASLAQGLDFIPPAHEALFLDAAAAYRANDHRKAILYAPKVRWRL